MKKIALFLMNKKGLVALQGLVANTNSNAVDIGCVVASRDSGSAQDYYDEIITTAGRAGIPIFDRADQNKIPAYDYTIAIGWRWLIPSSANSIIVLHDSLLPKLRGFNPLVTALIMGATETGVTAFMAEEGFDTGPIVGQEKISLTYPIKLATAIDNLSICYARLLKKVVVAIQNNTLNPIAQNNDEATYSLWRNDDDYEIDWNESAVNLVRFIDAVGFPYKGASTIYDGKKIRVQDAVAIADLNIINRTPGKILMLKDNKPTLVCGQGLLQITQATYDSDGSPVLFDKLRVKLP